MIFVLEQPRQSVKCKRQRDSEWMEIQSCVEPWVPSAKSVPNSGLMRREVRGSYSACQHKCYNLFRVIWKGITEPSLFLFSFVLGYCFFQQHPDEIAPAAVLFVCTAVDSLYEFIRQAHRHAACPSLGRFWLRHWHLQLIVITSKCYTSTGIIVTI